MYLNWPQPIEVKPYNLVLILNCCLWVPTFCSRSVLLHMSTWLLLESHKCSIGIACQCMAYKVASFNWTQMVQQYCMPFALACTSLDTWAFSLRPALVLLSFILICVAGCLTFENQESIRSPHTTNVNSTLNFLKEEIFRLEGHNSLYVCLSMLCTFTQCVYCQVVCTLCMHMWVHVYSVSLESKVVFMFWYVLMYTWY